MQSRRPPGSGSQRTICIMSGAPAVRPRGVPSHKAGAFCSKLLSRCLPKTRARPKHRAHVQLKPLLFLFSCLALPGQPPLKAGRPAASVNLPPPPQPCGTGCARSEASVIQSVAVRRLQALCRPHPQNGRPASGKPATVRPLP